MNVEVASFQLDGCQCRLKFDPQELQSLLTEKLQKKFAKKEKALDAYAGDLVVGGAFTEIDEGNFALHFMLAFLGKAWIAGQIRVQHDGRMLVDEPFRISATCAAFTGGRGQLKQDIEVLSGQMVKKTMKALR